MLWWGPLGVIGLSCANALGQYFKEITGNRVTNRMETELRKTMFARLVGTDLARLQTEAPAGLAARFSSDIGLIGTRGARVPRRHHRHPDHRRHLRR